MVARSVAFRSLPPQELNFIHQGNREFQRQGALAKHARGVTGMHQHQWEDVAVLDQLTPEVQKLLTTINWALARGGFPPRQRCAGMPKTWPSRRSCFGR